MIEIALTIARENKEYIEKLPCIRGMEVIFEQLMEKFGARLEEISVVQLDGFRAATIHAYENVIDN